MIIRVYKVTSAPKTPTKAMTMFLILRVKVLPTTGTRIHNIAAGTADRAGNRRTQRIGGRAKFSLSRVNPKAAFLTQDGEDDN